MNPQLLFAPPTPKLKIFAPSIKNGLFSTKKVSKSDRLTTAGSTSTCPKSGFTVPSRLRLLPIPILKSAPIEVLN